MKDFSIKINPRQNGACPQCARHEDCRILRGLERYFEKVILTKFDDTLEAVIYRCPEFILK
jgi:hypothetical protein